MIQILKHIKTRIDGEHSHKVLLKIAGEIVTVTVTPYCYQGGIDLMELAARHNIDCAALADDIADAIDGTQIIN